MFKERTTTTTTTEQTVRTTQPSCACLIELKTEFELEHNFYAAQKQGCEVRNIGFPLDSPKRSGYQFRGRGQNRKNNTGTTGKVNQPISHGILLVFKQLELLGFRATSSVGKPMSTLCDIADKNSPFLVISFKFKHCSALIKKLLFAWF